MITISSVTKNTDTDVLQIDVNDITKNVTTQINSDSEKYVIGDGIFDDLMETATKHLDAQWNNQRIRGEQYAEVYTQIYIKTLELALNAWIQKPKAVADTLLTLDNIDKTNAEIANVEKDTEVKECQRKLTCKQADHEEAKIELTDAQKDNVEADTEVKDCQRQLTCAQATHEGVKQQLTTAQKSNVEADTTLKGKQADNVVADTAVKNAQPANIAADTALKTAQASVQQKQIDVAQKQIDLMAKQIESETQKVEVYKAQAKGYEEDIKYKVFKTCLETWGMGFSVANSAFEQVPIPMNNACLNMIAKNWFDNLFGVTINFNKEVNENNSGYTQEED